MLIGGGGTVGGPDEAKGDKGWSRAGANKVSSLARFIPHDIS